MSKPNDHEMTSEEMKALWPALGPLPTERSFGDGLFNCKDCNEISRTRQCHECSELER